MGNRRRKPAQLPRTPKVREAAANIRQATRDSKGTDYAKVRQAFHDFLVAGLEDPES